jgi:NAD(P)-dependent dehydrogenase (short-subunit alcohol dehydrogenase family)
MKIILIGASGTIGKAVANDLGQDNEIIAVSRHPDKNGLSVDIQDSASIKNMYEKIGKVDAVIVTSGKVTFKPINKLTKEDFLDSFNYKLLGQLNLVLIGQNYLNSGGSFTLTSGIMSSAFIKDAVCATTVNCAINGFVKFTATEFIKYNFRINCVSPTILEESYDKLYPAFSGFYPVSSKKVAFAYRRSVTGIETGKIFDVV